jgi:hypothetical protein
MKDYLGDSVYAEWDGFSIILTTNNGYHDDPRNLIVLEPQVYSALLNFVGRIRTSQEPTPTKGLSLHEQTQTQEAHV